MIFAAILLNIGIYLWKSCYYFLKIFIGWDLCSLQFHHIGEIVSYQNDGMCCYESWFMLISHRVFGLTLCAPRLILSDNRLILLHLVEIETR